ncbi:MAG: ABC transporter permease [Brachybacterium sp.]
MADAGVVRRERLLSTGVGAISLVGGLAIWWLVATSTAIPTYVLPSPKAVLDDGVRMWASGSLQTHTLQTLAEIGQGAAIGVSSGIALAILFLKVPLVERLLMPIIVVLQVTPKISIAPLIVLWLGLGIGSKIALVALVTFYPVLINLISRLQGIPPTYEDLARVLNMGVLKKTVAIDFPYATPALMTGLKIGALQAVTAAVIGEYIGATAGLGFLQKQAQDNDQITVVLLALFVLCLVGWALYSIVGFMEERAKRRFGS